MKKSISTTFTTSNGNTVKVTTLTKETVSFLAEKIGYDPKTGEIRGNRGTQTSTYKLGSLIEESVDPKTKRIKPDGLYRPTVATIRINPSNGWHCCDGGNTFRGIYHALTEGIVDAIDCLILFSEDFDFRGYNQIDANRKPDQVLEIAGGNDGWGAWKAQLFGLACNRSQGKSVEGGRDQGRTWRGTSFTSSDSITTLFMDEVKGGDPVLISLVNAYTECPNKEKQNLNQMVETIRMNCKNFSENADSALLYMAIVDTALDDKKLNEDSETDPETFQTWLYATLPKVLDKLKDYIVKPEFNSKLSAVWKPAKGLPKYTREGKYVFLCNLIAIALSDRSIDKLSPKGIAPQGFAKMMLKSEE